MRDSFAELKTSVAQFHFSKSSGQTKAWPLLAWLLEGFILLSLFFACSASFLFCSTTVQDGISSQLKLYAEKSTDSRLYVSFFSDQEKSSDSIAFSSSIQRYISSSYYWYGNCYCSVANGDNEPVAFPFASSKSELVCPEFQCTPLFLNTYSNNTKFESLDLDLYKQIADEKRYLPGTCGAIFIPDFLADQLISDNPSKFSDYESIINQDTVLSVTVSNSIFTYRIANIFLVNGFTHGTPDERKHSDNGEGKRIQKVVGNCFAFLFENGAVHPFSSFPRVALCDYSGSQFLTKDWMSYISSLSADFSAEFSYFDGSGFVALPLGSTLVSSYHNGFFGPSPLYFALMISLVVLPLIVCLFVFYRYVLLKMTERRVLSIALLCSPLFLVMSMFYILVGILKSAAPGFSFLFLNVFGSTITIIITVFLVLLMANNSRTNRT